MKPLKETADENRSNSEEMLKRVKAFFRANPKVREAEQRHIDRYLSDLDKYYDKLDALMKAHGEI